MHSRILGLLAVLSACGWASAQTPAMNPALPPTAVAPPGVSAIPGGGGPAYPAVPALGTAPTNGCAVPAPPAADGGDMIIYGSAEYLLMQIRKGSIPLVATTAPVGLIAVNTSDLVTFSPTGAPSFQGTASQGFAPVSILNTATFNGGQFTNIGGQSGARVTGGFWADPQMSWGLEGSFFFLERGSDDFAAISSQTGNQFLLSTNFTRNLFLIGAGGARSLLQTFDVFVAREASSSLVGYAASSLYSGEINGRCTCFRVGGVDIGGLAGFRYLHFADELRLLNNVRLFAPAGIPQTQTDLTGSLSRDLTFQTRDRTRTYNHFFGAQVGTEIDFKFGAGFLNTRLQAAVGDFHQVVDINSNTSVINNDPGRAPAPYASSGGLLAAPGQNGRITRDRFGFIPEVNARLGYQFTDWLRGWVGYDGLVMVNVVRPGSSLVTNTLATTVRVAETPDVNVNVNQPTFKFRDQDVWVQGITFGLEARY